MKSFDVNVEFSTTQHHNGNTFIERSFRTLKQMLRSAYYDYSDKSSISEIEFIRCFIYQIAFKYNSTHSLAISQALFIVFFMRDSDLVNYKPLLDIDNGTSFFSTTSVLNNWKRIASDSMNLRDKRNSALHNAENEVTMYAKNDLVLLQNPSPTSKLDTLFIGPFIVTSQKNVHLFIKPTDKLKGRPKKVHVSQVKRYIPDDLHDEFCIDTVDAQYICSSSWYFGSLYLISLVLFAAGFWLYNRVARMFDQEPDNDHDQMADNVDPNARQVPDISAVKQEVLNDHVSVQRGDKAHLPSRESNVSTNNHGRNLHTEAQGHEGLLPIGRINLNFYNVTLIREVPDVDGAASQEEVRRLEDPDVGINQDAGLARPEERHDLILPLRANTDFTAFVSSLIIDPPRNGLTGLASFQFTTSYGAFLLYENISQVEGSSKLFLK
uniref:Integrase catalytic domain-containing protein n=1 Tax=Strongyloides venezuelensis TaxID=75913 RepID=A0A0K0FJV9_STRVS